ncbi:Platinum sensitivity protein [Tulasnella sp. 403]|nr:Platinum sensitivity protein [Tulasnella sp. 403]
MGPNSLNQSISLGPLTSPNTHNPYDPDMVLDDITTDLPFPPDDCQDSLTAPSSPAWSSHVSDELGQAHNPEFPSTSSLSAVERLADMRRARVYRLADQRWLDRGTALCTGIYDEELDQAAIVAMGELTDIELLRSEILVGNGYTRQQETLIVWTEPDGTDHALDFQDIEGCAEIYDFIMEVQRHHRRKLGGGAASPSFRSKDFCNVFADSISNLEALPKPRPEIICDIDEAIEFIARTPAGKEKICEYIVQQNYVKGLVEIMSQAENLGVLFDLQALCSLMETDIFLSRVDVVDTYLALDSCILFRQVDIINHVQNDEALLRDLFGRFKKQDGEISSTSVSKSMEAEKQVHHQDNRSSTDVATGQELSSPILSDPSKRDVISFLHQLCIMAKNVEKPARLAFYRALMEKGLPQALQWPSLHPGEDKQMLRMAGEMQRAIRDHRLHSAAVTVQ